MIFFSNRKKLEPHRRFGTRTFRDKIKQAQNYKRAFNPHGDFGIKLFSSAPTVKRFLSYFAILLVLFGAYYLFLSPSLQINQITIKGNRQVSTQEISDVLANAANSRFFLIKKNNFFLMTQGRVNQLLTTNLPTIKEVIKYSRTWPNKATIEIVEHTPGFVIESNAKYFLIDDESVVVSEVSDPQNLPVAEDLLVEDFSPNEILPNQKLAAFMISMTKLWNSKISTPITKAKFSGKSSNDVQFVTASGWEVLLDTTRSVAVQLSDLAVILNRQISPADRANLAYIDLRLSKWAYYCFKATPCQQHEQPSEAGTQINANK